MAETVIDGDPIVLGLGDLFLITHGFGGPLGASPWVEVVCPGGAYTEGLCLGAAWTEPTASAPVWSETAAPGTTWGEDEAPKQKSGPPSGIPETLWGEP